VQLHNCVRAADVRAAIGIHHVADIVTRVDLCMLFFCDVQRLLMPTTTTRTCMHALLTKVSTVHQYTHLFIVTTSTCSMLVSTYTCHSVLQSA
jgi:hypothetical protein